MSQKKVKLNLVGINGNAFSLMGAFQTAARKQGWTKEEIDTVLQECKKSDYDHLLQTLMENTQSDEEFEENEKWEGIDWNEIGLGK